MEVGRHIVVEEDDDVGDNDEVSGVESNGSVVCSPSSNSSSSRILERTGSVEADGDMVSSQPTTKAQLASLVIIFGS